MNLPNKITVGRMFGTLIFVVIAIIANDKLLMDFGLEQEAAENTRLALRVFGFVLMAVCGFSDILDGYIARKYNLITDFGKLMDPLSDKIYVMAGFIVIMADGHIHPSIVIIILAREFAVTGLRGLAANKGEVIAASNVGKLKTIFQMSIMGVGGLYWAGLIPETGTIADVVKWIWWALLAFITIFTLYTGVDYFWKARSLYMKDT